MAENEVKDTATKAKPATAPLAHHARRLGLRPGELAVLCRRESWQPDSELEPVVVKAAVKKHLPRAAEREAPPATGRGPVRRSKREVTS